MFIECPGDTISYNCSIVTNSETVQLMWQITFPRRMPINVTFDDTFNRSTPYNFNMNITATLEYTPDEYIESIITLTVLEGVDQNRTELFCRKSDLDEDRTTIIVNTSGKQYP